MATGCVIGDSLRVGAVFEPTGLHVLKIARLAIPNVAAGQPDVWTVIDFEVDDADADAAAAALSESLSAEGGWYADLKDGPDRIIIFAGKIFRYRHGDEAMHAQAVAHGLSVGVPAHQLDWKD